MSVSPITASNIAVSTSQMTQLAASAAPAASSAAAAASATLQPDTVTISNAGKAAVSGDGDSDGH